MKGPKNAGDQSKYIKISSIYIWILFVISIVMFGCKSSTDSKKFQQIKTKTNAIEDSLQTKPHKNRKSTSKPILKLPHGYKIFENIQGDLNGDGLEDYVLIVKSTNKANVVENAFGELVDRNRRGILIYLSSEYGHVLSTENLNCFSSENEDGGVYFPPDLDVLIEKGNLFIHYAHGRYGHWQYTFRFQKSDFELIGYDHSRNYGPRTDEKTSINFLNKKKLVQENINENAKGGDEVFYETWSKIDIKQSIKLEEILDFDELDFSDL